MFIGGVLNKNSIWLIEFLFNIGFPIKKSVKKIEKKQKRPYKWGANVDSLRSNFLEDMVMLDLGSGRTSCGRPLSALSALCALIT